MGPLLKLWPVIEGEKNSNEEDQVAILRDDLLVCVEQIVVLLGQCSNIVSYRKRFSLLSAVFPKMSISNELLKEKFSLLQLHKSELLKLHWNL